MVRLFSELPINDPLEDDKLRNLKDSFDIIETQANDFSLADSFLDFDSIKDYFEDKAAADMVAQENINVGVEDKPNQMVKDECFVETTILDQQILNGSESVVGSTCVVEMDKTKSGILRSSYSSVEEGIKNVSEPVEIESTRLMRMERGESENLGPSRCTIQEGLEKISLVGESQSLVRTDGNDGKSELMNDEHESESSESESADSSSSSSSSSYHSNSSSDSGSSTTSDDDDDVSEEEEKGKEKTKDIDAEIEEGEIRDYGGENLVDKTAAAATDDEDVEKMISWSRINDVDVDVDDSDDEDEDDSRHATKGPIRSKNELETLPPVPSVDVTLQPQHQLLAVGTVMSILGAKVIVEGVEKHDPLNEGSILWITKSRRALGFVDEIFGPVKNPYYVVRYNSENEFPEGIHVGTLISFVPEFANHVLNNKDLYKKGYDASGADDEMMSDEELFSDDEKEAEFERTHRMTKRGINDQNPRKRRKNRKKAIQKEGEIPNHPVGPATTLFARGNCSTFLGTGQGLGETTVVPPFQSPSAGLNPPSNGVWTNGTTFPQPQSSMLPNALTPNGISWFQENTQNSYQFPVPVIPFQQQLNPNQASLSTNMMPGMQTNIYRQPMFAPGIVNQNQFTFGLSSHLPQMQPPLCAEQGFLSNEWSERNNNFHSGINRGRPPVPHQFHRGTSTNRGTKAFYRGGRKGWRPAH